MNLLANDEVTSERSNGLLDGRAATDVPGKANRFLPNLVLKENVPDSRGFRSTRPTTGSFSSFDGGTAP